MQKAGGSPHAKMGKGDTASCSLNPACSDMWQPNAKSELIKTFQVFNSQQEQMYSFQRDDFSDPDQQAAAMTL